MSNLETVFSDCEPPCGNPISGRMIRGFFCHKLLFLTSFTVFRRFFIVPSGNGPAARTQ